MTEEAILYRELFQFFSPQPGMERSVPASAIDLPRPLARSVVHFYSILRTEAIAAIDDDLADQIAQSLSSWFIQLYRQLETNIRDAAPQPVSVLEPVQTDTPDQSLLRQRAAQAIAATSDDGVRRAILRRFATQAALLEKERQNLLIERALRLVTTPLADHLNDTLPSIAAINRKVVSIFRRPGVWNIFEPLWFEFDWNGLENTLTDVQDEDHLEALAQRLVRGIEPEVERKTWQRELRVLETTIEKEAGFGDILGLKRSSSPELALSRELSLLAYPETESLFERKIAESGIISLEPNRIATTTERRELHQWKLVDTPLEMGSIVVCVDTSGSMRGLSGRIASTAVLLLVRNALQHRRPIDIFALRETIHIASFQPDPLESPTKQGAKGITAAGPVRVDPIAAHELATIVTPLEIGGADISPALDEALNRIEDRNDRGQMTMDFVLISDIHFPKIGPNHLNRIYQLQSRGWARFHALTINRQPLYDPLNVFDYRWHYNTAEEIDFRSRSQPRRIGISGPGI